MLNITTWKIYSKLAPIVFLITLALLLFAIGEAKANNRSTKPVTVVQFNSAEEALESMAQELGVTVDELTQKSDGANHSRITIKNPNRPTDPSSSQE